jgi:hypothetical protein
MCFFILKNIIYHDDTHTHDDTMSTDEGADTSSPSRVAINYKIR